MYFYNGYHFWGMHLVWWCIWLLLISSLFGFYIPVQRSSYKTNSAIDLLKQRFAAGEITKEEYEDRKKTLEK